MRKKLLPAVPPEANPPRPVKDPKVENEPTPIREPQEKAQTYTRLL